MYSWYKRINENGHVRLVWEEQTFLAGCNNGEIPRELKEIIKPGDDPPIGWTIPMAEMWNPEDYSLVIEIKPNTSEVFLCEVDRVFGFSYESWSPIMLRLKILCSDTDKDEFDQKNFICPENADVIFTVLYMYGSIRNGELTGTWRPAFGTMAAVLLWPEAMTYFHNQIRKYDPDFLTAEIRTI